MIEQQLYSKEDVMQLQMFRTEMLLLKDRVIYAHYLRTLLTILEGDEATDFSPSINTLGELTY